ncbi:MAG: hypothetical protein GY842_06780 [bacterium]|nr:hypothetical protein [bacterium]
MDGAATSLQDATWSLIATAGQGGISNNQLLLIIVAVGVTVSMMVTARRRRSRDANSPRAYAREQLTRLREEAGIKDDLAAVLAQVQEVTRQFSAQLDTRFMKLERAIQDADTRLAEFARLAEGPCAPSVDAPAQPNEPSRTDLPDDSVRAAVCQLADAGHSPQEISAQTGRSFGEIELVLGLRRMSERPVLG